MNNVRLDQRRHSIGSTRFYPKSTMMSEHTMNFAVLFSISCPSLAFLFSLYFDTKQRYLFYSMALEDDIPWNE